MAERFEAMLTGGHPNSLGRTLEVVECVLADRGRFEELYECYFSVDEVVRLRTSNAMKRVCAEHRDWLVPYIDRFLTKISAIDQASTQWTLAQLFLSLGASMTAKQRTAAVAVLQKNLSTSTDWIVLIHTSETLGEWALADPPLMAWLLPRVEALKEDSRKSVANRASKLHKRLLKG